MNVLDKIFSYETESEGITSIISPNHEIRKYPLNIFKIIDISVDENCLLNLHVEYVRGDI